MKNDLTCAVARDLMPSYVDGLTSAESNEALERHAEGCADCRARLDAMRRSEEDAAPAEADKVVDYMSAMYRKTLRRTVALVAAAVAIIAVVLVLRLYVFGIPAPLYQMNYGAREGQDFVEIHASSSNPNKGMLWHMDDSEPGVLRITARIVNKSPLRQTEDFSYTADRDSAKDLDIYLNDTLMISQGIVISSAARDLYDAQTPYVGDAPALGSIAIALGIYEDVGMFDFALQTSREPYGCTLRFENYSGAGVVRSGGGLLSEEAALLNLRMQQKAPLFLAAVGNLSQLSWTYYDESGQVQTQTVTVDEVNAALPEWVAAYNEANGTDWEPLSSIKDYAASPLLLEQLSRIMTVVR